MAKQTAKKQKKKGKAGKRIFPLASVKVRVETTPLFDKAGELKAHAIKVQSLLKATAKKERGMLQKFARTMDDIQARITDACSDIDGGNPMFRDFDVEV